MENRSFTGQIMRDATNWCVVTAAVPAWASVLFPDDTPDAALDHLWDTLFRICRVYEPDPVTAWRKHLQRLAARAQYLNDRRFAALRFRGPGTDLTVGLPDDHLWRSGGGHSGSGIDFVANVPTEEVYTMPHRGQVDGVVRATMALSYSGDLIDDFDLEFAHGRVVGLRAGKGEATLRNLVGMDEGAGCLGEVALVPHSSPIAQTGLLFYNTLLDENAASHLALGRSYKTNLIDGASLSDEACWLAGANTSLVHVDFMIGSAEIDVDGIAAGGAVEPIMRKGEWSITL
jgi:aminopeptidase